MIRTGTIAYLCGLLALGIVGCGDNQGEETCEGSLVRCAGACVDTSTASAHCGGCGQPCDAGQTCESGSCEGGCGAGLTDCGGECVDTDIHGDHCGGCEQACDPGQSCQTGTCQDGCVAGETDCGGTCADTTSDLDHCGGCGQPCTPANGIGACVASSCSIAFCTAPYDDCDGLATTGCETDTDVEPAHCGGCAQPCDPGQACQAGGCVAGCDPGLTDCGGSCVDTETHLDHCGDCDQPCAPANGTGSCDASQCSIVTCIGTFEDCDGQVATGCEVDLATDLGHCGACGEPCQVANGLGICANSQCAIGTCDPDFDDCDGEVATGCETNLLTDSDHCNGCDQPCDPGQSCQAGTCGSAVVLPVERASEPIVVSGADLAALVGTPVSEVFVFSFSGTQWRQIPHQVDELEMAPLWPGATCPEGCELRYVFGGLEGNGLDGDDEIAFMARDLGEPAAGGPPAGTNGPVHEVAVSLPSGAVVGYAYLFTSTSLSKDFGGPLVSYTRATIDLDTEDTLVTTDNYQIHFSRLWVMDQISVLAAGGGDGTDLLDRWKGRAYSRSLSGETEDIIGMCGGWSNHAPDWGVHTYLGHIDGPVRAIRSVQGACSWPNLTRVDVFYDGTMKMILNIRGHAFDPGDNGLWGYWDFAQDATPMTYYNPLVPGGTLIDGADDPAYPNGDAGPEITEGWDQVDSVHGGVVFAFQETIDVPGPMHPYFFDDVTYDDGTGEDPVGSPGVIGGPGFHILHIASTEPYFGDAPAQVIFSYWPMPGDVGNVGATWAETTRTPLGVQVNPL